MAEKVRICPDCGSEWSEKVIFCLGCGARTVEKTAEFKKAIAKPVPEEIIQKDVEEKTTEPVPMEKKAEKIPDIEDLILAYIRKVLKEQSSSEFIECIRELLK